MAKLHTRVVFDRIYEVEDAWYETKDWEKIVKIEKEQLETGEIDWFDLLGKPIVTVEIEN